MAVAASDAVLAAGVPWLACPGRGHRAAAGRRNPVPRHSEGKQAPARRSYLNLGAHRRARAALEARRPPAVLDLGRPRGVDRGLPVLPEPVALQAGVQVIPRKDLGVAALPGGVPVQVHPVAGQRDLRALSPSLEGERLAPAVEPGAVLPRRPDDLRDP